VDEHDELYGELKDFIRKNNIPQHPLSRRQVLLGGSKLAIALAGISAFGGFELQSAAAAGVEAYRRGTLKLPEMKSIPSYLKGSGQVVLSSWGGDLAAMQQAAYVEPFQKLSGIKVIVSGDQPDAAKIKSQVDTGNYTYDVAEIDQFTILNVNMKGSKSYFEPLDYALFDTANILKSGIHKYGVDMLPYSWVNAYRTDVFKNGHPHGWQQWWDLKKFPGTRTLPAGTSGVTPFLEGAVMATGVPMDKVYPINIDAAYKSLDKVRKSVVKWWDSGQTPAQLLSSKEAVLANAWNGRIYATKQRGVPVDIDWYQGMLASDAWAILRGTPNKVNAQKFTAFMTLPISQARQGLLIDYGFVNRRAAEYISEARLAVLPTGPKQLAQQFHFGSAWWATNYDAVVKKWATWVLGM
jgi:putative spermidine/putrescine transport system substrate-binding protein